MSQSTEKSLGQVLYEAFAAGSFSFRKRDWASLAPQAQADFEREAQAVAAVVREQCAQVCDGQRVESIDKQSERSYNWAIDHCIDAIRSTK